MDWMDPAYILYSSWKVVELGNFVEIMTLCGPPVHPAVEGQPDDPNDTNKIKSENRREPQVRVYGKQR